MKATVSAGELAAAAALATAALDSKVSIPALHAARLSAADGTLRLGVSNLDQAIDVTVPAEIEAPGECAPNAGAIGKLAAGFPASAMIALAADAQGLSVQCGRSRYKLPILPISDLPSPLDAADAAPLTLTREQMLRLFERPQFAVSRETARYYLNGIFLHDADAGWIDAVATDGHRLAVVGIASEPLFPQSSNDRGLIVPLRTAELIVKLLRARKPENVTLARSQTLIGIAADGISLISKLIDATYPDYERLLPGPQPNAAIIDRDELIAALERLAAVVDHARERRDKVLLGVVGLEWAEGDNAIKLSLSRQPDAGTDLVDAALTGSAQIAFNVELLIEQLKELEGDRLRFDIGGNGGPTMITDPGDEGLVTLLMPILR